MNPALRRLALVVHVTASVGWFGAVVVFLALAVAALNSDDATFVRAAYVAMEFSGWYVIVPFSLAALATGIVQSCITEWGVFRHYWVVIKWLLTIGATALLPLHLRIASRLSATAGQSATRFDELQGLRVQIAGDAAAALVVLAAATTLSVYKPWGRIEAVATATSHRIPWGRYMLTALALLVLLAVVLHLTGSNMRAH